MDKNKNGDYAGPSADDYANVLALNNAFLTATTALAGPQRGRLAAAPFLLFSLRENDADWWDAALLCAPQRDLMSVSQTTDPERRPMQSAALSFLWQLSHRNPHTARIVSGAGISWCERIAAQPIVTLLNRVAHRDDLLVSRIDIDAPQGERLLSAGMSSQRQLRRSSQISALQVLLSGLDTRQYSRLSSAACSMAAPMKVFDKKV